MERVAGAAVLVRERIEGRQVACAALVALSTTVFFSVSLEQLSAALAWLAVIAVWLAGAEVGAGALAGPLVATVGGFWAASALSAVAGAAPAEGARIVARELLSLGAALAAAVVVRPAHAVAISRAFLVTAMAAGAWSIYQLVFEFGGTIGYSYRAHGFWHEHAFVSYANVLTMAFALALGLVLWGQGRVRALGLAGAALAWVGMLLSYTRSSWLVAAALLAAVSAWRRKLLPLVGLAALAAAVALMPGDDPSRHFGARARSSFDLAEEKNVDRIVRYAAGAAIVRDHPVLGTGPGGVLAVYPRYARAGADDTSHLHNTYLQLLAERGVLGLVAWCLVVGWAIVRAFGVLPRLPPDRQALAAGVGLALVAVMLLGLFNYHWEDWRVRALTLLFVGLAWSPAVTGATRPSAARPREAS
jgi:O-antigen ligase